MSEPNDDGLNGLGESVRRVAEDGLNMLLEASRNDVALRDLRKWASSRMGVANCSDEDAGAYVLDLIATLPKGTSLCIK